MNKTWKKKWLKALRSGEYEQTKGQLCEIGRGHDSFCCLGVLGDLWARETETAGFDANGVFHIGALDEDKGYAQYILPDIVEEDCGLAESYQAHLAAMNDGTDDYDRNPQTFSQIADWIEENL